MQALFDGEAVSGRRIGERLGVSAVAVNRVLREATKTGAVVGSREGWRPAGEDVRARQ